MGVSVDAAFFHESRFCLIFSYLGGFCSPLKFVVSERRSQQCSLQLMDQDDAAQHDKLGQ